MSAGATGQQKAAVPTEGMFPDSTQTLPEKPVSCFLFQDLIT